MSNMSDFAIFCPDGFNPSIQLVAISDGDHTKVKAQGTSLDLLSLLASIVESLLEEGITIVDISKTIAIVMSVCQQKGIDYGYEEMKQEVEERIQTQGKLEKMLDELKDMLEN